MGLGMEPGPEMGSVLKQAFAAQLDGEFDSVEGAIDLAQRHHCVWTTFNQHRSLVPDEPAKAQSWAPDSV